MSVVKQSPSFNSSMASYQHEGNDDIETVKVKNYVRDKLKSRIFLGRYVERRLIDEHVGYRDIVVISAAEVDLRKDLLEADHKLRSVYPNMHWIGITDSDVIGYGPAGVCIWTEIDNQPFGPFWFQIKTLKFRDEEIIVTIKCIRHITDAFLEVEPILTGGTKIKEKSDGNTSVVSLNETYSEFVGTLKSALSISNVKEFFTFLFAFIIAIFTGSTTFVNFLGNFILALLREISVLVKNSTPMFLGLLDFFSKIVGGFYILMAMFFKPNTPVPLNKRTIPYDGPHRRNEYYDDRQFD